jgi:hypothetical protein
MPAKGSAAAWLGLFFRWNVSIFQCPFIIVPRVLYTTRSIK